MRPNHVVTATLTLALALAAGTASAQDAQPGAAPAAPAPAAAPAAPADPATTTTTTTTTTTPAQPAPAAEAKKDGGNGQPTDEELSNKVRFRFAVHVLGGPWFVPDRTGGGGGAGLQLGVQINDMIGVYYAGTGAVAVATSNDKGGVGASAGVMAYNSLVGDVTLFRHLELGIGPSADSLAFGSADVKAPAPGVAPAKATALAGTYFGVQTRLGLVLGGKKAGKSGKFMLGLEVHPTFADETLVSTFITLGGGSF